MNTTYLLYLVLLAWFLYSIFGLIKDDKKGKRIKTFGYVISFVLLAAFLYLMKEIMHPVLLALVGIVLFADIVSYGFLIKRGVKCKQLNKEILRVFAMTCFSIFVTVAFILFDVTSFSMSFECSKDTMTCVYKKSSIADMPHTVETHNFSTVAYASPYHVSDRYSVLLKEENGEYFITPFMRSAEEAEKEAEKINAFLKTDQQKYVYAIISPTDHVLRIAVRYVLPVFLLLVALIVLWGIRNNYKNSLQNAPNDDDFEDEDEDEDADGGRARKL